MSTTPECIIETRSKTNTSLTLYLDSSQILGDVILSPTFVINCVVEFQFRLEIDGQRSFFVKFAKKRKFCKLAYTVTYTHSQNLFEMKDKKRNFDTDDSWHLCSINTYSKGTISVEVNLTTLPNPMESIYADTSLTDFKLCGEDGFVPIHKAIAAVNSPFFKTIFDGEWKETERGILEVPGVTQATLQDLKEYMYCGTVRETNLRQLLLLSSIYMMEDLKDRCLYLLRSTVTTENAIDLIQFAAKHEIPELAADILDTAKQGDLNVEIVLKLVNQ